MLFVVALWINNFKMLLKTVVLQYEEFIAVPGFMSGAIQSKAGKNFVAFLLS